MHPELRRKVRVGARLTRLSFPAGLSELVLNVSAKDKAVANGIHCTAKHALNLPPRFLAKVECSAHLTKGVHVG